MRIDIADLTIADLEQIVRAQKNLGDNVKITMKFKDNVPITTDQED